MLQQVSATQLNALLWVPGLPTGETLSEVRVLTDTLALIPELQVKRRPMREAILYALWNRQPRRLDHFRGALHRLYKTGTDHHIAMRDRKTALAASEVLSRWLRTKGYSQEPRDLNREDLLSLGNPQWTMIASAYRFVYGCSTIDSISKQVGQENLAELHGQFGMILRCQKLPVKNAAQRAIRTLYDLGDRSPAQKDFLPQEVANIVKGAIQVSSGQAS